MSLLRLIRHSFFDAVLAVVMALLLMAACSRRTNEAIPERPDTSKELKPMSKKDLDPARLETAILAGGCFWGMEDILRKIPGVVETDVGYSGGRTPKPNYEDVKTGDTGHAESVRVVFDRSQISYADLLEKWFFRMHDPTTKKSPRQ